MNVILSWIEAVFAARDFKAKITQVDTNTIVINGRRVEIRTARPTSRAGVDEARYQFNLVNIDRSQDWFLLAGCQTINGVHIFYVPGSKITGPTLQITTAPWSYTGVYAKYLNNHQKLMDWLDINKEDDYVGND